MVRSMGEARQDCDFAQTGFTAGQYGSMARTERDHMVQSMGETGPDRDRMVRSMGGTGQDRDRMVRSMGETRQDCDFAQPGLTAGQYGSIARTERDHMVRSMGGAGQDQWNHSRSDQAGVGYYSNDSYCEPPLPQRPFNPPHYRFPRGHSHRNGGEQWGEGNSVERVNLPTHIAFSGENLGEWESFREDFTIFLEINQIRNADMKYCLLRQALRGPAKDRLQTILKFGNKDPDFLLEKLAERYANPRKSQSARLSLFQMKQPKDTSDENWANIVEKAVFSAFPDFPPDLLNEFVIERFCSSLNEEAVHMHMTSLKFSTMAQALGAVRQFRESRRLLRDSRLRVVSFPEDIPEHQVKVSKVEPATETAELKDLVLDLTKRLAKIELAFGRGRALERDFTPSRDRSRSKSPVRCYNCGGIGHISHDCTSVAGTRGGAE